MNNDDFEKKVIEILDNIKTELKDKIEDRKKIMDAEESDSHILFEILGYDLTESKKIDLYHNIARLLYRSSATFLEAIVIELLCVIKNATRLKLDNPFPPPKVFNIDACIKSEKRAYELKWKHATTDGDHVNKEIQKPQIMKNKDIHQST